MVRRRQNEGAACMLHKGNRCIDETHGMAAKGSRKDLSGGVECNERKGRVWEVGLGRRVV